MKKSILLVIVLILLAAAFVAGRLTVHENQPATLTNEERAAEILDEVANLILLPEGEIPQMVLVEDAEIIKQDQPFLANAEDNDILMVYIQAQTAILYRPELNKLIAVGPVSITDESVVLPPEAEFEPIVTEPEVVETELDEDVSNQSTTTVESDEETTESSVEELSEEN